MTDVKTGCVKWFNNTKGYGFINNVDNGDYDLFVHHSNLNVGSDVYKTLTPGEYVEYTEVVENNKYYAKNVTGIRGGKLLCENRRSVRTEPSNRE